MRQRFSQDKLLTKQNSAAKSPARKEEPEKTLTGKLISSALTAAFFPAYVAYSASKTAATLPFMPMNWVLKRFVPNIVDDISNKKQRFQ